VHTACGPTRRGAAQVQRLHSTKPSNRCNVSCCHPLCAESHQLTTAASMAAWRAHNQWSWAEDRGCPAQQPALPQVLCKPATDIPPSLACRQQAVGPPCHSHTQHSQEYHALGDAAARPSSTMPVLQHGCTARTCSPAVPVHNSMLLPVSSCLRAFSHCPGAPS
jgi:hypothetical protein